MSRGSNAAGIGCGVILLLGIGCGAIFSYVVRPSAPRDAAQGFLADVREHDFARARDRMTADYQSSHDAAALTEAIGDMPLLADHRSATFLNASFERPSTHTSHGEPIEERPTRAVLDGRLSTSTRDVPIAVELEEAGGYWYVDAIVIEGIPLE